MVDEDDMVCTCCGKVMIVLPCHTAHAACTRKDCHNLSVEPLALAIQFVNMGHPLQSCNLSSAYHSVG